MRQQPFGDARVIRGEIALGDASVAEVELVRVRERHAGDAGRRRRGLARACAAGAGRARLATVRAVVIGASARGAAWTGVGVGRVRARFAHDVARLLVQAQSLEGRMAQRAVAAPLGERDLCDEIWPHPVRALGLEAARRVDEWRRRRARACSSCGASVASSLASKPVPTLPA